MGNLDFELVPQENIKGEEFICSSRKCPYDSVCDRDLIPDPRFIEKGASRDYNFNNFCCELGETIFKEIEEIRNAIPKEGSLEKSFKDYPEILKVLEQNKREA